jgi:hypothetical protein
MVTAAVARALGTSRRAAAVALWGPLNLARRCAGVIAALKAAGDDEALVRFIQPIDLAIHAARPATITDDQLPNAQSVSPAQSGPSFSPGASPGRRVPKETHGMRAGPAVCARCGMHGDQMYGHEGRVGDEERVWWFCPGCLDPHGYLLLNDRDRAAAAAPRGNRRGASRRRNPMKATVWMPSGTGPIEDLDPPAYTRALTPLSEIQRSEALRAADREDAGNRTFNRRFRSILASEAGGVPSGIDTAQLARWVSGILARKPGGRGAGAKPGV